MKVAVFHPSTQHSWQTATALQQLGRLDSFTTGIFYDPSRWPYRIERYLPAGLSKRVHAEFQRFEHRALAPSNVRTAGAFEWLKRMAVRADHPRLARVLGRIGQRRYSRFLRKDIESNRPFAVWGFNSMSLETFRDARRAGRYCILDRTIGDVRFYSDVMAPVLRSHPKWFTSDHQLLDDYDVRRDDAEYELADVILCGSQFCADTVRKYANAPGVAEKLRVVPYCFDETLFANMPAPEPVDRDGPVRFLFVGQVSMRKGIHHVLEAISQLPPSQAQLTVVGTTFMSRDVFARYRDRITHIPTVARAEIPAIMARHHAIVFPSYYEGSSLSLLEGLASGLALIHTPNAGNGVTPETGILLERPDTELTLAAMRTMIEDRDKLDYFRSNAQREAQNYTFARYRENIARLLRDIEGG